MPKFIFAYHGGSTPETEEEGKELMGRWMTWLEGLGSSIVEMGNPVGSLKTVSNAGVSDGGGANPLSGFTIIKADEVNAASEMAKGCPMVVDGTGSVEVAEIHEM